MKKMKGVDSMFKKFLFLFLSFTLILVINPKTITLAYDSENIELKNFNSKPITNEEYFEYIMGPNSIEYGNSITWTLDENGQLIRIYENRSLKRKIVEILVVVGTYVLGHIQAEVVGGIVKAVTGKSGSDWVATAINAILNKEYKPVVNLNCDTIPKYAAISGYCN